MAHFWLINLIMLVSVFFIVAELHKKNLNCFRRLTLRHSFHVYSRLAAHIHGSRRILSKHFHGQTDGDAGAAQFATANT